ncbi:Gfo/Idh/MocA family oxidoreductase [Curtobacterium flaccumfaciens pv. beticola]|uniref:Gfo/Idh/MocA family oxidoreductase n=1 Tax=Curtobacterium citreum TaxID=2036 RepID=A0A850DNU9_9MICO|nr:Gfo/Idh/MocA family oxidoreductase [Curtobacterium albidum]MCS5485757.1 Gfo/Idh/MocA family oxidoreductase [Curtobacterium flaccumfaciens pv. basellae]NUU27127.1 Gfo/Idh/MocA family oxidoreductase [Curtobacterium albidum]
MGAVRTAVIGLGMMGRHHTRVLRSLPGVELVAVADALGDRHGVADGVPVMPSASDVLRLGIDAAVVAVPTSAHEAVALELAEAGVHCLVEKPVASDVAGATRMVSRFDEAGLVGAVGHIERYNSALQELRRRLDAGELGEVYQVVTRRQGPFPARIADVGVVKDLATHDIDLTSWLLGSPFVRLFAQAAHKSGREHEDLVAFSGTLADGTVTNHLVNWLSPFKERVTIVTGEGGSFVADTLTGDLWFHENGTVATEWDAVSAFRGVSEGPVTRFAFAKREPLVAEHEAFRDAVLGDRSRIVPLCDGLQTLRVAEAAIESARTLSIVHPLAPSEHTEGTPA